MQRKAKLSKPRPFFAYAIATAASVDKRSVDSNALKLAARPGFDSYESGTNPGRDQMAMPNASQIEEATNVFDFVFVILW